MDSFYCAQFDQDWHLYKIVDGKAISVFSGQSFWSCVKFANTLNAIVLRQQRPPKKIRVADAS